MDMSDDHDDHDWLWIVMGSSPYVDFCPKLAQSQEIDVSPLGLEGFKLKPLLYSVISPELPLNITNINHH